MTLGFLTRPRSKKRMLLISLTTLLLWYFSPSSSSFTNTTTSTTGVLDYLLTHRPTIHSQMLDHLQKPLCPRFSKYDRQKLLLLEPTECTPIKTEHPDFSADICFSPFVCNEGLVRVRRRDRLQCKEANLRYPISGNSTHDAFHRQFSGPDSFHVVFSGSEKLSPPDWYHAGQCLYIFPFHISNPGKLSLDITHLYDNFGAVVEQSKEWPVLQLRKVVSSLPLEVCRGCPSRVAQPRFSSLAETDEVSQENKESGGGAESVAESDKTGSRFGKMSNIDKSSLLALGMSSGSSLRNRYQAYTKNRANSKYDNLFMNENYDRLPLCSRDHSIQGVWLPAHPLDKQSWRRANYTWTPLGCQFGKPLDKTCLVNKSKKMSKILFQGDTHLRVAMEELLRRLNGSTTLEIRPPSSMATDRLEETHASTTFTYLHDPLLTNTNEKADMLVANMGHWATGTKFFDQLMSTSKYHDKLRDLIETIQQHARDLQDLQDEDDGSLSHFLDDGEDYGGEADDEDGHDYEFEDEEEDEAELEREHEELRQKELAKESSEEATGEEVYWEDETEQEIDNHPHQEDTKQLRPRPSTEELEDQQGVMDDTEDKYRVGDRQRAESEGYISRNQNRDPMGRPRARYPPNHILRQSKHVKSPTKPKIEIDESEVEEKEGLEEEQEQPVVVRNRYRYGAKKIMLGENSKLMKVGEDDDEQESVKVPSFKKSVSNSNMNKKTTTSPKARSASAVTPASKKTTVATKKPASPAFRDPYAYSTRKTVSATMTSKPSSAAASSGNKREKPTAGTKKGSTSSSPSNKKKTMFRRTFLDDDYPFLTSKASSTPSSSSSSLSSSSLPRSDSDSLVKMAWVGMVAYPETQPADPIASHDWRTIYRLRYWNLIAEDVMLLHNVRFMDFFSMTLSMLDTSPDRAHYYGTDAGGAMLEELAFKLGLCEDEE
ncbi:hypothetical protein BG015_008339 [Linnemannia schmuckeri]|uniref:Uncharacterized protein n=1 Tax=Linnemannia schmuckeri TaxID=64567 RepID=A0A9P5RX44_9FUNG|nr:hypothetical protein BG015_008339 [Linnemannia schmuckeri]